MTLQKDPLIAIGDIQGNPARGQWELSATPHTRPVRYKGQQHLHIDGGHGQPRCDTLAFKYGEFQGSSSVSTLCTALCFWGGSAPLSHRSPLRKPPLWGVPALQQAGAHSAAPQPREEGEDGSVILEEREEVIVAAAGQVGGPQVGEQLIRIRQLGQELETAACDDQLPAASAHPPTAAGVPSHQ